MAGAKGRSGGTRPGAGRPPNAIKYQRQIAKATDVMGRMLPAAAQATVDLAGGAYVLLVLDEEGELRKARSQYEFDRAVEDGRFRVYRELPDVKAIQIMFERLMGKVPQPIDVRYQQALDDVVQTQAILMRLLEEHVPAEALTIIRAELGRVAELHRDARAALGGD